MGTPETHTALLVLLFGGLVVLALLAKAGCGRLGLPPLVAYIVLGLALRYGDEQFGMLAANGREILGFLASLGVIALLFRVGLESDLPGLVKQLANALPIWAGNVAVAGLVGYLAARYLLGFDVLVSLVIATAMTATSVGIPARIWQGTDQLNTDNGQRFLDVAELDDLSGVVLMGILFAMLPVVQEDGASGAIAIAAGRKAGVFLAKLIAFAAACVAFSHYVEARFTRFVRKVETGPDPMLVVVGTGVLVAALAGVLGFSVAIGAFFAGLVFSRDPQSVKVDASFTPLYDLFTPFFFVGVGLAMDPEQLPYAAGAGAVLLVAAVVGKILGTTGPALACTGLGEATALGVSMVPRAEITMLIMHRAKALGEQVAPPAAYGGMVVVSAATCLLAPPVLRRILRANDAGRQQ